MKTSRYIDDLPPPKRDVVQTTVMRGGGGVRCSFPAPQVAPTSMRVYNNASGGCCAEGSSVLMKDGTNKLVENIVKGDEVQTKINGIIGTSKIQCVIVTLCNNNKVIWLLWVNCVHLITQ